MKRTSILQRSGAAMIANPAEYRQPTTEQLDGRYPYEPDPQPEEPEVSLAYGAKQTKKLLRIISDAGLSTKTRVLALSQLRDVVSSQEAQAEVIRDDGVMTLALGIKRKWEGDAEVVSRSLACDILAELALNRAGRSSFRAASAVPILVRALDADREHASVRAGASAALCSMSEFRDGLDIISTHCKSIVKRVVASLADTETAVLANMARFFANATGTKFLAGPILQNGGTEALAKLLGQGKSPHRRTILVSTLTAIGNLAHSQEGNKVVIALSAAKRIAEATTSTLQYVWEDVARASAGALLAVAGSEDGKKQIHAYAIPLLSILVQVEVGQVGMADGLVGLSTKNNAGAALRIASEYPPALELALLELLPSTRSIVFVYGADAPASSPGARLKALRVLTRWLLNADLEMRTHVVRAIASLLQQDPRAASTDAVGCLNIVRDLVANARELHSDIGKLSGLALETLCSNSQLALNTLRQLIDDGADIAPQIVQLFQP